MVIRAKKQLILVKIIDFTPLVPQKLSVESSMNDDVYQKKVSNQACILESTAQLHPNTRIFLIFITSHIDDILQDKLLSVLLSFKNIYIRYIQPVK